MATSNRQERLFERVLTAVLIDGLRSDALSFRSVFSFLGSSFPVIVAFVYSNKNESVVLVDASARKLRRLSHSLHRYLITCLLSLLYFPKNRGRQGLVGRAGFGPATLRFLRVCPAGWVTPTCGRRLQRLRRLFALLSIRRLGSSTRLSYRPTEKARIW